jgi:hypothetical protein
MYRAELGQGVVLDIGSPVGIDLRFYYYLTGGIYAED